jgi:hypothetical protein
VSDQTAKPHVETSAPSTVAEILQEVEPMDDLGQFAIDDLTADEEDEFFRILADI